MNTDKSKVMVGSSDGNMSVNSGKGVQAITVKYTVCKRWIHTRYSDVRGNLSLVVDGFRCERCEGTVHEADLAKDLVMDGETYGCVKIFCNLGDTLDGDGGWDLAATSRIRNVWMKLRQIMPFLTSRAPR